MDFPKDAKYLLDWSPASGMDYAAFLQSKKNDFELHFAVAEPIREKLGTIERLAACGYQLDGGTVPEGWRILVRDVSAIARNLGTGTSEMTSALRWGICHLAADIEGLNASSKQLVETLENPSLTWAYEQFVQARDEYNRGLYGEALKYITYAIEGDGPNAGYTTEFRFHFLLGRIRIGGWFGDYPNTASDVIDPEAAETAFLDAENYRRHARPVQHLGGSAVDPDRAEMLLWAGRAAYILGEYDRAVDHAREAVELTIPEMRGLYPACLYQYARFLCTRGGDGDAGKSAEILDKVLKEDLLLAIEMAADPEFVANPEILDPVLNRAGTAFEKEYASREAECGALLGGLGVFSYDDTKASELLAEEFSALSAAHDTAAAEAAGGGILDLAAATKTLAEALPKPGALFAQYKARFANDRWEKWESLPATEAAREATDLVRRSKDAFLAAENVYRENGGFNRGGGGDKLGYAIICAILSFYLFFANLRLGSQTIAGALLFLVGAAWALVAFARVKLGLVKGYEQYRATRSALAAAQVDAERKENAAAKIWQEYQQTIDGLSRVAAPF